MKAENEQDLNFAWRKWIIRALSFVFKLSAKSIYYLHSRRYSPIRVAPKKMNNVSNLYLHRPCSDMLVVRPG